MITNSVYTRAALMVPAAALLTIWASAQSTPSAPPEAPAVAQQAAAAQSGYVLKVTTRLVTLDVIATDSREPRARSEAGGSASI